MNLYYPALGCILINLFGHFDVGGKYLPNLATLGGLADYPHTCIVKPKPCDADLPIIPVEEVTSAARTMEKELGVRMLLFCFFLKFKRTLMGGDPPLFPLIREGRTIQSLPTPLGRTLQYPNVC